MCVCMMFRITMFCVSVTQKTLKNIHYKEETIRGEKGGTEKKNETTPGIDNYNRT